jgi:phycobilisome core component
MKEMIEAMAEDSSLSSTDFIASPFDHMTRELSELSV